MQHAIEYLLGSIWHLTYSVKDDGSITIKKHWRDDYAKVDQIITHFRLIEIKGRIVTHVLIGPEDKPNNSVDVDKAVQHIVNNPQHVFSYTDAK